MVKIDDKQACQIHGILSSDSDSDCDGKKELDEEYNLLKPPPLDIESIKDRLVVISPEHNPKPANVWEERMKITEDDNETDDQIESNAMSLPKKKKKKKFKYVITSLSDEDLSVDDLSEPPNKKQPDKIWYDPEILKEMGEQLDKLNYYGLWSDVIAQELDGLQKIDGVGCLKSSNDSNDITPKRKRKKKKQKQSAEDMEQLDETPKQETEVETNEGSSSSEVNATTETPSTELPESVDDKAKITPLQELEYTFGDDFKDFIQTIVRGGTNISHLNSFTYEQLSSAYKAHLKKRTTTATQGNTIGNVTNVPVQQNVSYPTFQNNSPVTGNVRSAPIQQSTFYPNFQSINGNVRSATVQPNGFYPTLQNTAWNCPANQNAYQTFLPVQQNWPWNYPEPVNTNMLWYQPINPGANLRLDVYLPPNPNGGNLLNPARCIPSMSTDKVILTEIEDGKTTNTKDKKDLANGVEESLNLKDVVETNKKTVESVQGPSQSVTVKEKCEVRNIESGEDLFYSENFDTALSSAIQIFMEGRKTILLVYRKAQDMIIKREFSDCADRIANFSIINEEALRVIKRCLEMCTNVQNDKKPNGTIIENKKDFIKDLQHSETVLTMYVENVKNCKKRLMNVYKPQYDCFVETIAAAYDMLEKCKVACNNINKEIKKSICGSMQADETAFSKNDNQETCIKSDAPFPKISGDEKNKSVAKDNKILCERNTEYSDDEKIQSISTQQNLGTIKTTGTKNKEKPMQSINGQANELKTKESIGILITQGNMTIIQSLKTEPEKTDFNNTQNFIPSKNFNASLKGFIQTFTEARQIIVSLQQKAEVRSKKQQFSKCKEPLIKFLTTNEVALCVIKLCLEKCTQMKNEKSNGRINERLLEICMKDFQHSDAILQKCIEDIEDCERKVIEIYSMQYNAVMKFNIRARGVLEKCRLTCNNIIDKIQKSLEKSGYGTAQVVETALSKNDFVNEDKGLATFTNSNESATSIQNIANHSERLLLSLEKPNDSLKSSQEVCSKSNTTSLENNEDEKNKPVISDNTSDKTLNESTDNLDDKNDIPCRCHSTKNSTPFSSITKDILYENGNFMGVIDYFVAGFSSDLSWCYIALLSLIVYLIITATECIFSFLGDNFFFIWATVLIFVYLNNQNK